MSQKNDRTKTGEKKHLTEKDRYQIEALVKAKKQAKEIAEIIGCSRRTIKRELQRGKVKLLDRLERKLGTTRFRQVFKSTTCDNGCENLDAAGIERSLFSKTARTKVYYAHPYSAYKRGANEGDNVLIRRFVPKETDIGALSRADVKRIAHWMNHYPRRKLEYASAFEQSSLAPILSNACVI